MFQHPEYILCYSSTLIMFCEIQALGYFYDIEAPSIYSLLFQHPKYILCYPSTLVYVKLLLLWALVLATDYLLEFRFEYLW